MLQRQWSSESEDIETESESVRSNKDEEVSTMKRAKKKTTPGEKTRAQGKTKDEKGVVVGEVARSEARRGERV